MLRRLSSSATGRGWKLGHSLRNVCFAYEFHQSLSAELGSMIGLRLWDYTEKEHDVSRKRWWRGRYGHRMIIIVVVVVIVIVIIIVIVISWHLGLGLVALLLIKTSTCCPFER